MISLDRYKELSSSKTPVQPVQPAQQISSGPISFERYKELSSGKKSSPPTNPVQPTQQRIVGEIPQSAPRPNQAIFAKYAPAIENVGKKAFGAVQGAVSKVTSNPVYQKVQQTLISQTPIGKAVNAYNTVRGVVGGQSLNQAIKNAPAQSTQQIKGVVKATAKGLVAAPGQILFGLGGSNRAGGNIGETPEQIAAQEKYAKQAPLREFIAAASLAAPGSVGVSMPAKVASGAAINAGLGFAGAKVEGATTEEALKAAGQNAVLGAAIPIIHTGITTGFKTPEGRTIQSVPAAMLEHNPDHVPAAHAVEQAKADLQAGKPIEPVIVKPNAQGKLVAEGGNAQLEAMKQAGFERVPIEAINPENPESHPSWQKLMQERQANTTKTQIPKELQPLAQEALKYKSADEFVKAQETPKTITVWKKSRFSDGGAYVDVPIIRKEENITLYHGGDQGQFWTPNKKYAEQFGAVREKTGTFYQVDNGNRMTDVYVEAPTKSQLTDIYNQATKGAPATAKNVSPDLAAEARGIEAQNAFLEKNAGRKVNGITIPEGYKAYRRTITGDTVDVNRLKTDPAYFKQAYESTFARGMGTDEKLYKTMTKELVPKGREPSSYLANLYNQANAESKANPLNITPSKNLPPEKAAIEKSFSNQLNGNVDQAVATYQKEFGKVLNTDSARELSKDYAPGGIKAEDQATKNARSQNSAAVHEPASALIKEIYKRELKTKQGQGNNTVLFTAGGTGAGKSTAIRTLKGGQQIINDSPIIYDTNLANFDSSKTKINQALAKGYDVKILYVHANPEVALNRAVGRAESMGRTVPLAEHVNTHVEALDTIKQLADHYKNNPKVDIQIVDNTGPKESVHIVPLEKISEVRYNKGELQSQLERKLNEQYQAGQISKNVYEGTIGKQALGATTGGQSEIQLAGGASAGRETQKSPTSKVSGVAQKVDAKAVEAGTFQSRVYERLKAEHPEQLTGDVSYQAKNMQADIQNAVDLLAKDKNELYKVATGAVEHPDITQTSANIVLAEKALEEGNDKLYNQLITNRSLAQTRRGQELVAEKGSITDNSPDRYVKELIQARLNNLGNSYTGTLGREVGLKGNTPKQLAMAAIDRGVAKVEGQIKAKKLDVKTALSLLDKLECLT